MMKTSVWLAIWREWLQSLVLIAAVIFPFRSAVADWNSVPTGSMNPTIVEGDRIFVNKLAYDLKVPFTTLHLAQWANPEHGDVVVLYAPDDGMRLVKRVVGVPGDVIVMRNEHLYLNGQPLDYAAQSLVSPSKVYAMETLGEHRHFIQVMPDHPALRDFGPVRVPEGKYFVMGDNRDNSRDSRYFGFVQRDQIVGRATAVVASFDPDNYYLPRTARFFKTMP